MSKDRLPKEAERAIGKLRGGLKAHYPDAIAYLFGSYARGTWLEDSDLDIVVVSERFEGQPFVKRVAVVRQLAPKDRPFEILAYTPAEFRQALRRSVAIRDGRRYWHRIV